MWNLVSTVLFLCSFSYAEVVETELRLPSPPGFAYYVSNHSGGITRPYLNLAFFQNGEPIPTRLKVPIEFRFEKRAWAAARQTHEIFAAGIDEDGTSLRIERWEIPVPINLPVVVAETGSFETKTGRVRKIRIKASQEVLFHKRNPHVDYVKQIVVDPLGRYLLLLVIGEDQEFRVIQFSFKGKTFKVLAAPEALEFTQKSAEIRLMTHPSHGVVALIQQAGCVITTRKVLALIDSNFDSELEGIREYPNGEPFGTERGWYWR